jgi:predicted nucleic acid-binding protein
MEILIDTDALFAIVDKNDVLHMRALKIVHHLVQQNATIYILPTTLAEFATLTNIRIGFEQSKRSVDFILRQGYQLIDTTSAMVLDANALYQQQTSKENSLADCFNMIAARRQSVDCLFSFDGGYTQNGFVLVENFLQSGQMK